MNQFVAGHPQDYPDCPFTEFASDVSPLDEAKIFPIMYQRLTNKMRPGFCRSILTKSAAASAVIGGAHDRFMEFDHPGAACRQDEIRFDMLNHLLYWERDDLFVLDEPEPTGLLERMLLGLVDRLFPHHREHREKMAANLRTEKMVAKYLMARSSVIAAMFSHVVEQTADDRQAA